MSKLERTGGNIVKMEQAKRSYQLARDDYDKQKYAVWGGERYQVGWWMGRLKINNSSSQLKLHLRSKFDIFCT